MVLTDLVRRHLTKSTPGFWIGATITGGLSWVVVLLLARIFLGGAMITHRAIESGQRATVHIATSEVAGNTRHTKQVEATPAINIEGNPFTAPITSKEGLAQAPLASISEQSDRGILPIAGQDGTLAWKYYARPYNPATKRPIIAVILTNIALSKSLTQDVLHVPHDFTLSFSPYANDAKIWAKQAREIGFESLVDLPLEPENFPLSDAGPYGIDEDTIPADITSHLHWALSRITGFVGVTAPISEKLVRNATIMRPILTELTARGVLFVYMKIPQNIAIADMTKAKSTYGVGIDLAIDDEMVPSAIESKLQALVTLAKTQGYAVGIAHSYPTTTEELTSWAASLDAQGIDLVPLSAIAARTLP